MSVSKVQTSDVPPYHATATELCQFVERFERLEEEQGGIAGDIHDV